MILLVFIYERNQERIYFSENGLRKLSSSANISFLLSTISVRNSSLSFVYLKRKTIKRFSIHVKSNYSFRIPLKYLLSLDHISLFLLRLSMYT